MTEECSQDQYLKNLEVAKQSKLTSISPCDCCSYKSLFDSTYDANLDEHLKIIKKIGQDVSLIICLGLGIGLFYLASKKWLKKEKGRRLVFIEDLNFPLDNFLRSSLAKDILADPQVQIHLLEDESFTLKKIAWENVLLKAEVIINPFYSKEGCPHLFEIKDRITLQLIGANLIVGDYSDFGAVHLKNTFKNLLGSSSLRLSLDLKGAFKNIPAIICGGGLSSKKNIDHLKKLEKKALIFSGGAGLNILSSGNLSPHFAANIDKRAPKKRFDQIKDLSMPHFVQLQMSYENYLSLSSEKILIPPFGSYPLELFVYERLKLEQEPFEIGWTVGSAMIALSAYLGCSPIIFLGLEFCFTDSKYPENIPSDEGAELIETLDLFGRRVFTQKDWLLAKGWIEDFAKEHKEISFINASEGILSKDIPFTFFEEVAKEGFLIDRDIKIEELVREKILLAKTVKLDVETVKKVLLEVNESAKRCLILCNEKLKYIEDLFTSGNFGFKDFEKENFYCLHLLPLWNIFSSVIKRDVISQKKGVDPSLALFINRNLFYKNVLEKYLEMASSIL